MVCDNYTVYNIDYIQKKKIKWNTRGMKEREGWREKYGKADRLRYRGKKKREISTKLQVISFTAESTIKMHGKPKLNKTKYTEVMKGKSS